MRASVIFAFLLTVLLSSSALAEDEYVGAIWSVKVKNKETGQWDDYGVIRCTTDGKVYREGKVIGSHKNVNLNNVQIEIPAKDATRLGGTWKATRLKKDGAVWHGVFTRRSDGKEFVVALLLKADWPGSVISWPNPTVRSTGLARRAVWVFGTLIWAVPVSWAFGDLALPCSSWNTHEKCNPDAPRRFRLALA